MNKHTLGTLQRKKSGSVEIQRSMGFLLSEASREINLQTDGRFYRSFEPYGMEKAQSCALLYNKLSRRTALALQKLLYIGITFTTTLP